MNADSVDRLLRQWQSERPDLDVSSLGIAIRIEMLAKLLRRGAASSLAAQNLKTWEYDVLSALRRQGPPFALPATELARESLLTSGAMTTRIDQLEQRKLVRREPDANDRRGIRVSLTSTGLRLVDRAICSRVAAARDAVSCLRPRERSAAEAALRSLLIEAENK